MSDPRTYGQFPRDASCAILSLVEDICVMLVELGFRIPNLDAILSSDRRTLWL
jgi:hypothetical protein